MSEQVKGQSKTWRDAIAACINDYDSNEKLREVLERTDASYLSSHAGFDCSVGVWMPTQPEGFADPVKGIHPPKKVLDSIQDALNAFGSANAEANEKDMAARAAANNADSPHERQQALEAIKFCTPELLNALNERDNAFFNAGVCALSIRSPFFVFEDTQRKSRSADKPEKHLFAYAQSLIRQYPSKTRRLLHDAKTKEEREQIIIQCNMECRARLSEIAEGARKARMEREKIRLSDVAHSVTTPTSCGKLSEIKKGQELRFDGKLRKFTGEKRWKVIELLMNSTDPEGWVKLPRGSKSLGTFDKGDALTFKKEAIETFDGRSRLRR